jgi:hypothetical protein
MKTYVLILNLNDYTPLMVRKFYKEEVERFFTRREFEILTSVIDANTVWELRFNEKYDGHLVNALLANDNHIVENAKIIEEV